MRPDKQHVALARQALTHAGGRAPLAQTTRCFRELLGDDELSLLSGGLLQDYVRQCLNRKDDKADGGLPWAVSSRGEYVQRPLLSLEERKEVMAEYMRQGRRYIAKARIWAEETYDLFGEWVDVETLGRESA